MATMPPAGTGGSVGVGFATVAFGFGEGAMVEPGGEAACGAVHAMHASSASTTQSRLMIVLPTYRPQRALADGDRPGHLLRVDVAMEVVAARLEAANLV